MQLYVTHPQDGKSVIPLRALKGFRRITLKAGTSRRVAFMLSPEELALTDATGRLTERAGEVTLFIGGGQPGYADGESARLTLQGDSYSVY